MDALLAVAKVFLLKSLCKTVQDDFSVKEDEIAPKDGCIVLGKVILYPKV